jgi:hypothetical protein
MAIAAMAANFKEPTLESLASESLASAISQ